LRYWRETLAGSPVLALPTDRPRPAVQTFREASLSLTVPRALLDRLAQLGRRSRATLFMVLTAAYQALLARSSGQTDVSVGAPVANRTRGEIEGLIGFFLNMLTLRGDLAGDPGFDALLARVRRMTLGAFAHQDLPFEKVVEALAPDRDLSRSPLFQVILVLQNAPMEVLQLPELKLIPLDVEERTAKLDLSLVLEEKGAAGLLGKLRYNRDLFDAPTMARLLGHWQSLLAAAAEEPGLRLSALPLLSAAEAQQLREWNATAAVYPLATCLHQLIEAQVERTPEAPAVVFEGEVLSYREIDAAANRVAHRLRDVGV